MTLSFKNLEHSKVEISFKLDEEEFNYYVDESIKKLRGDSEINGFRKGKAPREVVMQHFGEAKVVKEAALEAIKVNYIKAIKERKLEPIGQPQVEVTKLALHNPLEFKIVVSILPSVVLPDYKEIASQVKRREVHLEAGEVEKTLAQIQKARAKFIAKNGICQKGDWVEIEIHLKPAEEEKFKIFKPDIKDSFILGEGHLLPIIEKEIEGMEAGQTKDFSFVYPADYYQRNLAGKKVLCHLQLKSIQRVELPDISDDFAKRVGRFKDLDDLKNSIKEGILIEKKQQESQRVQQEILDKIVKAVKIDIPEVLIEKEKERMLKQLKEDVTSQLKMKFDDYLEQIGKTEKEIEDSFSPVVIKRIKESLVLREIGRKEKIDISEAEVEERINQILSQQPSLKDTVDLDQLKIYTKEEMVNSRTLKKLEDYSSNNKKEAKVNN